MSETADTLPTTPKGKIARLPARLREAVNRRLHDGETAGQILPWLNSQPEVLKMLELHFDGEPVSAQNLSAWRQGGFQKWLAEREEIESTKALAAFASDLAAAAGGDMAAGAKAIATGKIMARLQSDELDIGTLLGLVKATKDMHGSDVDAAKLRQAERKLANDERDLALRQAKFERETAELFLKWYDDKAAREIAASKETKEVKMDALVQLIFGQRPEAAPVP